MPATPHRSFSSPAPETKIWRYMDLAKFVSLLDRQALFLSRVGLLSQNDPYEGRVSHIQATLTTGPWPDDMIENALKIGGVEVTPALGRALMTAMLTSSESLVQDYTFVNCWHMNSVESDAMWRLYSLQGQGIAIQSTYERLERSLYMEPRQLFLGRVQYSNYETHYIDTNNAFNLVLSKRASFIHENELRIAHTDSRLLQERKQVPGVYAQSDLEILIESVVVSPASPSWLTDVVRSLAKRYNLNPSIVRQSPLYAPRP